LNGSIATDEEYAYQIARAVDLRKMATIEREGAPQVVDYCALKQ
jgi:hypothetical protein